MDYELGLPGAKPFSECIETVSPFGIGSVHLAMDRKQSGFDVDSETRVGLSYVEFEPTVGVEIISPARPEFYGVAGASGPDGGARGFGMRNVFEPPNAIVRWLGPCYDPLSE